MGKILFLVVFILVTGMVAVGYSWQQSRPKPITTESRTLRTSPEVTEPLAESPTPTSPGEIRAGFAIFTNGTFRIFTDPKYHRQSELVYIDAAKPNVVIVGKPGATWGDFFSSLPMSLTKECLITGTKQTFCTNEQAELQFFINGEKVDDALDREIQHGDRLLVTYGKVTPEQYAQQYNAVPSPKTEGYEIE